MITQTAGKFSIVALAALGLVAVAGCSTQAVTGEFVRGSTDRSTVHSQDLGARAAAVALRQVGVPYRYGGSTTAGFDCSGLVQFAYQHAGKPVPRTTGQLWSATVPISRANIEVGDLLFFSFDGKMSHVGMYVGAQQFVHAPSSGRSVTVAKLTSAFYSDAFVRAGRPD